MLNNARFVSRLADGSFDRLFEQKGISQITDEELKLIRHYQSLN